MRDCRYRLSLALKATAGVVVAGEIGRQDFDANQALERAVAREKHRTHATGSQTSKQPVAGHNFRNRVARAGTIVRGWERRV